MGGANSNVSPRNILLSFEVINVFNFFQKQLFHDCCYKMSEFCVCRQDEYITMETLCPGNSAVRDRMYVVLCI